MSLRHPLAALTACGSTDKAPAASDSKPSAAASSAAASSAAAGAEFGPGCAAVPPTGPGSFAGMAQDPVATAASHNPVLSTLVTAVQKAGLVDHAQLRQGHHRLRSDQRRLREDSGRYPAQGPRGLTPDQLASGQHSTLQGGKLTTSRSGNSYTVNVVCGNVRTANATVYIIDTVLMPKG